ncbi:MAG: hypothetical protein ACRD8O_07285 [Bryobacteraceae bacterium]
MQWIALAVTLEAFFLRIRLYGDVRTHVPETIGLLISSGLFYLVSSYLVCKLRSASRARVWFVLGAALVFRLTVWPLAPALSDDVFRYRWEASLQNAGGNPYEARPNDPEWAHLRDATFPYVPGRDFRSVYGPLAELGNRWLYRAAAAVEPDPFRQSFWFKLPAALFDLGVIGGLVLLLRARGLPAERVLIYAWSPLSVFEFWATGHNDSIALCFVVLALVAAARTRWSWGFGALSLATAVKLWPVFLMAPFIGWPARWRLVLIPPLVLGALALPFAGVDAARVVENLRFLSGFVGGWRNNDSGFALILYLAGGDLYVAKRIAFSFIAGGILFVTLRRWPLERAALAVITLTLMVSANCHPWYLTWLLPMLVVEAVPALLLWTALAPLAHVAVIRWVTIGEWQGLDPMRWCVYAAVYGMLGATALCRFTRARARPVQS